MFGFFKKKRLIEGPIEFEAAVDIDRPATDVFPLIDIADPRFCQVQRGAQVSGVDDFFTMSIEAIDDAVFEFEVLERVEGSRHKAQCVMVPQLFALVSSVEDYTIEPLGENACRVNLVMSAEFDPNLSDEDVAGEIAVMSVAVDGDLAKLKVLAEEGVEAVKAMEEAEMGDCGFDLDDFEFDWDNIDPEQ